MSCIIQKIGIPQYLILFLIMGFIPGDIVWVPASTFMMEEIAQFWPAKFLRQTNRPDICIVSMYGTVDKGEQFLVDTDEVYPFDSHKVGKAHKHLLKAYQSALKDLASQKCQKIETLQIANSDQLCDFIQTAVLNDLLASYQNINQPQTKAPQLPQFIDGKTPLGPADLKTYFKRRIPQLLAYLLDQSPPLPNYLLTFCKTTRQKIVAQLLQSIKQHQLDLTDI